MKRLKEILPMLERLDFDALTVSKAEARRLLHHLNSAGFDESERSANQQAVQAQQHPA